MTAAEKRERDKIIVALNDLTARLDRVIEKLDEREREEKANA